RRGGMNGAAQRALADHGAAEQHEREVQLGAALIARPEPAQVVQPAKVRSTTQRSLPSPEPCSSPRLAITGLTPRLRSSRRYWSWSYPRSASSRSARLRGRPGLPVTGPTASSDRGAAMSRSYHHLGTYWGHIPKLA